MKIGVAGIVIAGGLAWLLFGRGGRAAQAVVKKPAPAPPPRSPLEAIARGYVYDPTQRAFVPPAPDVWTSPKRASVDPLDIVGQVFYDPTVENWYVASPNTGRELGWDRQPNMIPVSGSGSTIPLRYDVGQPALEVLPYATKPITRLPATGFEVSVVPVAYPVERGSTPTIKVTLSNRSDKVATVGTGVLVLRTKGNVDRIRRPLASGGDLILYPGQSTEIPFSFYVPFWWGGVYDLFVYAGDRARGTLTDDKYSSVLYVFPGEEGPQPEENSDIGG